MIRKALYAYLFVVIGHFYDQLELSLNFTLALVSVYSPTNWGQYKNNKVCLLLFDWVIRTELFETNSEEDHYYRSCVCTIKVVMIRSTLLTRSIGSKRYLLYLVSRSIYCAICVY